MLSRFIRFGIGSSLAFGTTYGITKYTDYNSWSVVRFGRVAATASAVVIDYKWNLRNLSQDDRDYEETLSKIHLRSAHRLKDVCCKNGGCFIKVGQHIGGLDYLLPNEYVKTMKVLHNKAPESNIEELFETVEKDLNCKITDIFKEIDSKPIGTASLAQVHRAVLHDGTVVAVKIQHPKVKSHSHGDIRTIAFFVNLMHFIFPKFEMVWLAEETRKNLPIELDFINEGRNAEKVAKLLENFPFVRIPKIYWNLTSDRVLTMDYCEGGRVDDLEKMKEDNIDVNQISKRLGMVFSEMIFTHGFVHCDPHPGNVLINPLKNQKKKNGSPTDFEIVLIDHGLYQTLSKPFRYNYANLWMSIINRDIEKLKEDANQLDSESYYGLLACIISGRSWDAITNGINVVKYTQDEGNEIKAEAAKYLREISEVLNRVPREMLLLLKTNDLLRGTETCLNSRNSSSAFIYMSQCCVRLIRQYERDTHNIDQINKNKSIFGFNNLKFNFLSYILEQFDLFKVFIYKLFLIAFDI